MQPKLQQTNKQKNPLGALQTGEAYLMQHAHGAMTAKSAKQPCKPLRHFRLLQTRWRACVNTPNAI